MERFSNMFLILGVTKPIHTVISRVYPFYPHHSSHPLFTADHSCHLPLALAVYLYNRVYLSGLSSSKWSSTSSHPSQHCTHIPSLFGGPGQRGLAV